MSVRADHIIAPSLAPEVKALLTKSFDGRHSGRIAPRPALQTVQESVRPAQFGPVVGHG